MTDTTKQNEVTIDFLPNGPVLVKGTFSVKEKGEMVKKNGAVAICRCGHAKVKPYCDGSHKTSDFKSD